MKPKFAVECNGSHAQPLTVISRGSRVHKPGKGLVGPKARGLCAGCETEQQVNDNGTIGRHNIPFDPTQAPAVLVCPPDLWALIINTAKLKGIANPSDLAISILRENLYTNITQRLDR